MNQNPYESPKSDQALPSTKWYWLAGDIVFLWSPLLLFIVAIFVDPRSEQPGSDALTTPLYETAIIQATLKHQLAVFVPCILWCGACILFRRPIFKK